MADMHPLYPSVLQSALNGQTGPAGKAEDAINSLFFEYVCHHVEKVPLLKRLRGKHFHFQLVVGFELVDNHFLFFLLLSHSNPTCV